jgi:hypothetical protein
MYNDYFSFVTLKNIFYHIIMVCGIECMSTCHIHFQEPKTLYLGYSCNLLDQNLGSTTSVSILGFVQSHLTLVLCAIFLFLNISSFENLNPNPEK